MIPFHVHPNVMTKGLHSSKGKGSEDTYTTTIKENNVIFYFPNT